MKTSGALLVGLLLSFHPFVSDSAEDAPPLYGRRTDSGIELSWPATTRAPDGSISRPYFELERSGDLQHWNLIGERMHSESAAADQALHLDVSSEDRFAFYRLHSFAPRISKLASDGAETFGYANAFANELNKIGQISVADFAARYDRKPSFLTRLSWDPTTTQSWRDMQQNVRFALDVRESAIFKTNGFVVSERLGASTFGLYDSFADLFYNIWNSDLPVFISTDAILQAWHRTYDAMLEETEETYLSDALQQLLQAMTDHLKEVDSEVSSDLLKTSVRDVDFHLTVARSLLAGTRVSSVLGQDQRVADILTDVRNLQLKQEPDFFGQCRVIDFSQFQVRGHYIHTQRLGRYFQAMMWLGRIDFPVAGGPFQRCPDTEPTLATPREAAGAIVLWDLLQRSGQLDNWLSIDGVIQTFVGWSDSLGFAQLGGVLAGAGIRSVRDVPDLGSIERLQASIAAGDLGVQNIRSDYFISPLGPEQIQLPRAFLVFGQRFGPDSWALSQNIFDSIKWTENGKTTKVNRRVPSALDVAFSVLGNDQMVPELVTRMSSTNASQSPLHAVRWRDGLPYQHNLSAVRNVIDGQNNSAWQSSIYMGWLAALRELSAPTVDPSYPEAMRTRAWAMKTLNTQLASWTQLRHDTLLYLKQSYTAPFACSYPAGYVEPRITFWQTLADTAERAATLIDGLPYSGSYTQVVTRLDLPGGSSFTNVFSFAALRGNQVAHFRNFAAALRKLAQLSDKELRQECFDPSDDQFIRDLIQVSGTLPFGSGGIMKFDGWYPQLFYHGVQFNVPSIFLAPETNFQENYGAGAADRLVADVHTDLPSLGDEGGVLHQGIGKVNMLIIAIESGADRITFAGPVLSHYEFEITGDPVRLTDMDWDYRFQMGTFGGVDSNRVQGLTPPSWTSGYLVPQQ